MSRLVLQLKDIRKSFSGFKLQIDLEINQGELVSILGPSGSGKTTTLRIIAGLEAPSSGSVLLRGTDITSTEAAHRQFGYVPQDFIMFPHLDVSGNIAYGLRVAKTPVGEIKERVAELLSAVGLEGYEKRAVDNLSGGERQRVALARALAIQPELLLLDEPFSALDTPLRKDLRAEILNIKRIFNVPILFVTHSQEEALSISDRIIVMRDGRVTQTGPPFELFNSPIDAFTAQFVGTANLLPVICEKSAGGKVHVVGDGRFVVCSDGRYRAEEGDAALILVRPHRLCFGDQSAQNALRVTISRRQYFGHLYEYVCESEQTSLIIYSEEKREIGEDCWLAFRPGDATLIPTAATDRQATR